MRSPIRYQQRLADIADCCRLPSDYCTTYALRRSTYYVGYHVALLLTTRVPDRGSVSAPLVIFLLNHNVEKMDILGYFHNNLKGPGITD